MQWRTHFLIHKTNSRIQKDKQSYAVTVPFIRCPVQRRSTFVVRYIHIRSPFSDEMIQYVRLSVLRCNVSHL